MDSEPSSALMTAHEAAASLPGSATPQESLVEQNMALLYSYHEKVLATDGYTFISQVDPLRPVILATYLTTPLSQSDIARHLNLYREIVHKHIKMGLKYTFPRLSPEDQATFGSPKAVQRLKADITPRGPKPASAEHNGDTPQSIVLVDFTQHG
jgi:hypothetical protein